MKWKSILSAAAPLVLLWPALVSSNPVRSSNTKRQGRIATYFMVFRGENRSPAEIRNEGGFRPEGTHYWDSDASFHLYRHIAIEAGHTGEGEAMDTAFVTVAPFPSAVEPDLRWRYAISATPNILTPFQYGGHQTGFALGGIHWDQVTGWYEQRDARGNPRLDNNFTPNPDYRPERYASRSSTPLRSRPNWRLLGRQHWMELMQRPEVGPAVGFTGTFPLPFEQYPLDDSIPGPGPSDENQLERPVSPSSSAADSVTLEDVVFVADFMNRHPELCNRDSLEPETIDLTMEVDGERHRCVSVRTRLQSPVSPSTSTEDSMTLDDITFISNYVDQSSEVACDFDSLEPETADIAMEVDGQAARYLSQFQQGSTSVLHTENQSIHDTIVRMRDATEPASCGLVTRCLAPRRQSEKRDTEDARLDAFCSKVHKLQTKHQDKGQVCHHVKGLKFHFKIFDWYYSGTYSRTRALLAGPSGKTSFDIAEQTLSGLNVTIPVDVKPFGSDTLDLDAITNITIETQTHWYQTNDKFEIESVVLRGECVETGFPIEVTKYQELEQGNYLSQSDGSDNHEPGWNAAVTYHIKPSDWHMRPKCVYIDQLEFDFFVGNDFSSPGTYDTISLTIGKSKQIQLAEAPWGGTTASAKLDLREHFGSDELPVAALTALTVVDTTGTSAFSNDVWELGGITLKARCARSDAMIKMSKFAAVKEAVQHKTNKKDEIVWRDNFGPADWVNV